MKRMTYFCYQENNKCTCYLYMITSVLIIIATSIIVKNKKNNNYCCCSCSFFMLLKYIFLDDILISQHCKKPHLCWSMDVFLTVIISFCIPFLSHLSLWTSYQVIFVNYRQWNVVLLSKEINNVMLEWTNSHLQEQPRTPRKMPFPSQSVKDSIYQYFLICLTEWITSTKIMPFRNRKRSWNYE